jgi:hypothetical protein
VTLRDFGVPWGLPVTLGESFMQDFFVVQPHFKTTYFTLLQDIKLPTSLPPSETIVANFQNQQFHAHKATPCLMSHTPFYLATWLNRFAE